MNFFCLRKKLNAAASSDRANQPWTYLTRLNVAPTTTTVLINGETGTGKESGGGGDSQEFTA